jgi:excisionase family DNA binding protein
MTQTSQGVAPDGTAVAISVAPAPPCPLAVRPAQAAVMIGVGRSRLYELLKRGALSSSKVGDTRLIHVACLQRFLDSSQT